MSDRTWSFTLPYPALPKGLSMNYRGSHWPRSNNTAMVRRDVFSLVRAARIPALDRCQVDVCWLVKTKTKRDSDNLAPLLKAIYDGIGSDRGISARIVEDDSPEYMVKRSATIHYDKANTPGFVVTITALPPS